MQSLLSWIYLVYFLIYTYTPAQAHTHTHACTHTLMHARTHPNVQAPSEQTKQLQEEGEGQTARLVQEDEKIDVSLRLSDPHDDLDLGWLFSIYIYIYHTSSRALKPHHRPVHAD